MKRQRKQESLLISKDKKCRQLTNLETVFILFYSEMLKKIREMKANLLSLKKEQLSTTTRLTILQNHQLTS